MAQIAVKYFTEYEQYRYADGQTSNPLFTGNFGTIEHNGNYTLLNLDEFDVEYTKEVKLKAGEKLYRITTPSMQIIGARPLIKINLEKCLVYFLVPEAEEPVFITKGVQLRYLNLKKG